MPLTCRVYLLTAVWVTPKSLAASFCFNPYVCVNSLAIADRRAGTSDFTATSHGSNMVVSPKHSIGMERYISMTYVMFYMTYVIERLKRGMFLPFLFSPFSLSAGPESMIYHGFFMAYAVVGGLNCGS